MKLLWRKAIAFSNMWEPTLDGVFISVGKKDRYYFKMGGNICFCEGSSQEANTIKTTTSVMSLPLPRQWKILEFNGEPVLAIDKNRGLLLEQDLWIDIPKELSQQYVEQFQRKYIKESFPLQEYTVSQYGNWGYECWKNEEKIWRFTGKGYLYTDIVRWDNRIFFGTAGRGGYFYILDIVNGQVIAAINTGGTRYFVQVANSVYIMTNSDRDNHAELICIHLADGTISKRLALHGVATANSKLQLLNNKLHAVTFEYVENRLAQAIWNGIEI